NPDKPELKEIYHEGHEDTQRKTSRTFVSLCDLCGENSCTKSKNFIGKVLKVFLPDEANFSPR
ncbi:MAG: hypothetical protein Q7T47_01440, partial [Anaerolineales bacterium]|nr:hypothetical protein [Anaerolineales bacterium]